MDGLVFFFFYPCGIKMLGVYLFIYPIWADLFTMMDDGGSKAGMEPGWAGEGRIWTGHLPIYLPTYFVIFAMNECG